MKPVRAWHVVGLLAVAFLAGLGAREVASQVSVAASRLILAYVRITGGSALLAQEGLFLPAAGRLGFAVGGTSQWEIDQSGDLVTTADNTENIGNIAGLRPANAYFGTAVAVGNDPASAGSFRIASGGSLQARNGTGSGNIVLLQTDLADTLIIGSGSQLTISVASASPPVETGIRLLCVSATTGKIFFGRTFSAVGGCGS